MNKSTDQTQTNETKIIQIRQTNENKQIKLYHNIQPQGNRMKHRQMHTLLTHFTIEQLKT